MSLSSLKQRLPARLEPVANWTPDRTAGRSDFDLNPEESRPARKLKPAAVLIPVIARPEGATVLLTRRADSLTSHPGQIAFPGGRLDPGETASVAALREAWEEVALAAADVEVLGLGDAYETGTGFLVTPVVGWLKAPPEVTAAPDEVAELFEVPWDFLMDRLNHRQDFLVETKIFRCASTRYNQGIVIGRVSAGEISIQCEAVPRLFRIGLITFKVMNRGCHSIARGFTRADSIYLVADGHKCLKRHHGFIVFSEIAGDH